VLEGRKLIDKSASGDIEVIGVTARSVLAHAADIFDESSPTSIESAALEVGELASQSPILLNRAKEYISDKFKISSEVLSENFERFMGVGFVDFEGENETNTLLFNGNLFKREAVQKTNKVLESLNNEESGKLRELNEYIGKCGCVYVEKVRSIAGGALFSKLRAAGLIEINTVSNEDGEHSFVTLPGSFHKYVNPLIDDGFDLAKALVSALTYGMQLSRSGRGRILSCEWILNALIEGRTIGPATAIGADYRILEQNRVVQLFPAGNGMFRMKLLKREVGELALQVLKRGEANAEAIQSLPGAPANSYRAPERDREMFRKKQQAPSKRHTFDILSALRGGRDF
jgi:hypothetical protein